MRNSRMRLLIEFYFRLLEPVQSSENELVYLRILRGVNARATQHAIASSDRG